MAPIDVDDIVEISYEPGGDAARITLKDGAVCVFEGEKLQQILPLLNHWTPPTA